MEMITRRRSVGGAARAGAPGAGSARRCVGARPDLRGLLPRVAPERNFLALYNWSVTSGDQEADDVCRTAAADLRRVLRVAPDYWFFDDRDTANALNRGPAAVRSPGDRMFGA